MMKPTLPATFQAYLAAPPPGSALARAIAYGIDPTLTFFNMYGLTREERLTRAGATVRSAMEIAQSRLRRSQPRVPANPILDAIDLLNRERVNFVLIGGSAAILHGAAYVTQDVDFCCSRKLDNLERIAKALNTVKPRFRVLGLPEGMPTKLDVRALRNGDSFAFIKMSASSISGFPSMVSGRMRRWSRYLRLKSSLNDGSGCYQSMD